MSGTKPSNEASDVTKIWLLYQSNRGRDPFREGGRNGGCVALQGCHPASECQGRLPGGDTAPEEPQGPHGMGIAQEQWGRHSQQRKPVSKDGILQGVSGSPGAEREACRATSIRGPRRRCQATTCPYSVVLRTRSAGRRLHGRYRAWSGVRDSLMTLMDWKWPPCSQRTTVLGAGDPGVSWGPLPPRLPS